MCYSINDKRLKIGNYVRSGLERASGATFTRAPAHRTVAASTTADGVMGRDDAGGAIGGEGVRGRADIHFA
jgi:hypothetical protein